MGACAVTWAARGSAADDLPAVSVDGIPVVRVTSWVDMTRYGRPGGNTFGSGFNSWDSKPD